MYGPLKEYLNEELLKAAGTRYQSFNEVRSLRRGGGFTLRERLPNGRSLFIRLQHTKDRDYCQLFFEWSNNTRPPEESLWFAPRYMDVWRLGGSDDSESLRRIVTQFPNAGEFPVHSSSADPRTSLEIEPGGPDWLMMASRGAEVAKNSSFMPVFYDDAVCKCIARGEVPPQFAGSKSGGHHGQLLPDQPYIDWQLWFEDCLKRLPTFEEVSGLCENAISKALLQLEMARSNFHLVRDALMKLPKP